MKIAYVSDVRMPTEKAHGLQIIKTCEAFADLGHQVTLYVPLRNNSITSDAFEYYAARRIFDIRYIWSWDLVRWGKLGFLIQYTTFSLRAACVSAIRSADLIYGRDELTLSLLWVVSRSRIIWESHVGAWNSAARFIARQAYRIVTISGGLKDFYISKRILSEKIIVAPDAVDLSDFDHPQNRSESRERLGIPMGRKIALYIGRLDGFKGSDVLCEASHHLPDDIQIAIIGGDLPQLEKLKIKYPRVLFLGPRPYRELADNQASADVLILPNSGKSEISTHCTSPLKLFTYMTSGIPIIASDLPSIREVLDDTMAYFVTPDDPAAIAETISKVLNDTGASGHAQKARQKVQEYSWIVRARTVLSGL